MNKHEPTGLAFLLLSTLTTLAFFSGAGFKELFQLGTAVNTLSALSDSYLTLGAELQNTTYVNCLPLLGSLGGVL